MGEAMHHLGIPTTRALAAVTTGAQVRRDGLLPGAVLARVAQSHIRVGTFQFFAIRDDHEKVRQLVSYTLARHFPEQLGADNQAVALLREAIRVQANLIAQWMLVGFIHGVMNTDNMSVAGETIDYGPCAFMDAYDPATVFSSIDHGGRYAYANQPLIARWNLARFAETLLPLIAGGSEDEADVHRAVTEAMAVINAFPELHAAALLQGQRAKLGLQQAGNDTSVDAADAALAADWLTLLHRQGADFTLAWRRLADAAAGDAKPLRALLAEPAALTPWLVRWQARCAQEDTTDPGAAAARVLRLRATNPAVIPRNHQVEAALSAASDHDDLQPFERLLDALRRPYADDPALAPYTLPAPPQLAAGYQTFCGT